MLVVRMVVAKERLAVDVKIPNDNDVNEHHHQHVRRKLPAQFVDFDGHEESRFPNGQPSRPEGAVEHPNPFHQRKEREEYDAKRPNTDLRFGHIGNLLGEMLEKLVFRVDAEALENMLDKGLLKQVFPFRGQVMGGLEKQDDAKSAKENAFDELENNDGVERGSAFS